HAALLPPVRAGREARAEDRRHPLPCHRKDDLVPHVGGVRRVQVGGVLTMIDYAALTDEQRDAIVATLRTFAGRCELVLAREMRIATGLDSVLPADVTDLVWATERRAVTHGRPSVPYLELDAEIRDRQHV